MCEHEVVKIPRRALSNPELLRLLGMIDRHADFLKAALHINHLLVVCSCDWLWFPWFTAQGLCESSESRRLLIDCLCWLAQEDYPERMVKWELQWITEELGLQAPKRKHLFSMFKRKDRDYELPGL